MAEKRIDDEKLSKISGGADTESTGGPSGKPAKPGDGGSGGPGPIAEESGSGSTVGGSEGPGSLEPN